MPVNADNDLRWILTVIRRWLWIIVGCILFGMVVAFVATTWLPPTYKATTTLLVEPSPDFNLNDYSTLMAGERLALTYSEMLKGPLILKKVINQLDLQETPEDLSKKILVEPIANTQLMRLSVNGSSPEQAALLANTIADIFTNHVQTMQEERFADILLSKKGQIEAASLQINETESTLDELSAQKIEDEAKLVSLQATLSDLRDDQQIVQKDYQEIQLIMEEAANSVMIVETAQALTQSETSPYVATITLLVNKVPDSSGDDYATILASERLAQTYGEILGGRSILEAALSKLGSTENPEALARRVKVEPISGTQLLRLSVEDENITQAKQMADTLATVFLEQLRTLLTEPYSTRLTALQTQLEDLSQKIEDTQTQIKGLSTEKIQAETDYTRLESQLLGDRTDYRALKLDYEQLLLTANDTSQVVSVAEPAQLPESAEENRVLYVGLAGLTCAVMTIGIAFLREYLDDTIRSSEDVSLMSGTTTLATIGLIPEGEDEMVVLMRPRSPTAEAFRMLAANIQFYNLDRPLRKLLVTSPSSQEGKSFILANLATAMASSGKRIIVVDADLRMPRLHQLFKLDPDMGLTDSLINSISDGNMQSTELDGLKVITSGKLPPNPVEVVGSARMQKLLKELEKKTDLIILDSPPVLPVADAAILASLVDGVILVLRAGQTGRRNTQQAVNGLKHVGTQLIGIVLNAVPGNMDAYNSYYRYAREDKKSDSTSARVSLVGKAKNALPTIYQMKMSLATMKRWFINKK